MTRLNPQHPIAAPSRVLQSERKIPVLAATDVLIVGGSTAAVAAAEAAARGGANVFLVAPFPYLGEDLCATLRLSRQAGRPVASDLEEELFGNGLVTTPGRVKAVLTRRLVDAGVAFVYSSTVTNVLRDCCGSCCGAVIANRAGRQAVVAKVMIDATDYAWVCRQAGCALSVWGGGRVAFERTSLVRDPDAEPAAPQARGAKAAVPFLTRIEAVAVDLPDFSFASLMRAEQAARAHEPGEDLLRAADRLFCVPPVRVACRLPQERFAGISGEIAVGYFQTREEDRIYVLGGCADLPRNVTAEWLKPAALAPAGAAVGRAAAAQAAALPRPAGVQVTGERLGTPSRGVVCEILTGGRPFARRLPVIRSQATGIAVLAEVDVVVIGGGTAGGAAAIAAARQGVKTLVVEAQEGLGGVGTVGLIADPYHGIKAGFAAEVPFPRRTEEKMAWYRREILKAGGEIWLGTLGCGAYLEGKRVRGVAVSTPQGRGVVRARVVIDATGSADIAISAGARYRYGDIEEGDLALQGTGLSARLPGVDHNNSDYLLVDEADTADVWRALASVHLAGAGVYDFTPLIQNRERRRVVGDFTMRYVDQIAGRTYPDSVVFSGSDYDSHGYPSSPLFALLPHDEDSRRANHPGPGGTCYTPYRCLLPRKLDGILVCGLGISMDRDATAMVRMQYDLANQGYAAGVAAAMAVRSGRSPRRISVRALQRHLVAVGNLPAEALTHADAFPLPTAAVRQAVADYGRATNPATAGKPLGIILTHPARARPLLKAAYERAEGHAKLFYAQALGALGEPCGVPTLLEALARVTAWDEKIFQGHMADFAFLPTPVDQVILALGWAGERSAVPAILGLLETLDATVTHSHHRAVALALERLADPAAAAPLAALLAKPGMTGHALTALPKGSPFEERTASLREITLARALLRCGDYEGLGRKIMEQYANDLRGLFARHARAMSGE